MLLERESNEQEYNNEFYMTEDNKVSTHYLHIRCIKHLFGCAQVRTRTNRSGGIQGGLANGEDIVIRVAFKPTSTIAQKQKTVGVGPICDCCCLSFGFALSALLLGMACASALNLASCFAALFALQVGGESND